jgi:hypothetical protein
MKNPSGSELALLSDLISLAHIEEPPSRKAPPKCVTPNYVLVWGDRSQTVGTISEACRRLSSLLALLDVI